MIKKLENVTKKSFQSYTFSNELNKCNIFFGTNGSGKTSLSAWIAENTTGVRKFDTNYVLDNISTVDTMRGVELIVGAERIDTEEMIHNLEEANNNLKKRNDKIISEELEYKNKIYEYMNSTLDEAREKFRLTKKINQKKKAREQTLEALRGWANDIKNLNSDVSSSEDIEKTLNILKSEYDSITFDFELSKNVNDERIEEVAQLLHAEIIRPDYEMTMTLKDWLEKGIELHSHGENICKFCQNKFDSQSIKENILSKLHSNYTSSIESLESNKTLLKRLKQNLEEQPDVCKDICVEEAINNFNAAIEIISQKLRSPSEIINQVPEFFDSYLSAIEHISSIKEKFEIQIRIQEKLLENIESVAKSWVGKQILNEYSIEEVQNQLILYRNSINNNNEAISENEEWITQKRPTGNLKPFAELVNHEFKVIGLDFKIEISDDTYIIKSRDNFKICTKDLSEGERRLLGFLHFYYDLYLEPMVSLKDGIEVVLIDDPITSLDSDNRYYMTELLNSFIDILIKFDKQIFIFTHSSIDFHNFGYSVKQDLLKAVISKDVNGYSEIKKENPNNIKNYSNYYKSNFKQLYNFSKLNNSQIVQFPNSIQFGNKGRLVLESHARSNYCLENATTRSFDKLVKFYKIPDNKRDKFKKMLDIINSLSHGLSYYDFEVNNISSKEIRDAIRVLIGVMYQNDKNHVATMIELPDDSGELKEIGNWF